MKPFLVIAGSVTLIWGVWYREFIIFPDMGKTALEQTNTTQIAPVQALQEIQAEYLISDANTQKSLIEKIKKQVSVIPADALPTNLDIFVSNLPQ